MVEEDKYSSVNSSDDSNKKKEIWEKGKERFKSAGKQISSSLESDGNERLYSAFSYIPIIGPIIVWIFKSKKSLGKFHASQATYLQILFFAIGLAVWLLENLPLISAILRGVQFVPIITNAIMYVNTIALIIVSIYAALQAKQGLTWRIPILFNIFNSFFKLFNDTNQSQLD